MQAWLASAPERANWSIEALRELAASTEVGAIWNVTFFSQDTAPLRGVYEASTFLNHNAGRFEGYGFAAGSVGSTPHHIRAVTTLRRALAAMWGTGDNGRGSGEGSVGRQHYLSIFLEDFVPALVQPLADAFWPAGCLRDDRFDEASAWDGTVDLSTTADCRDLNSLIWLGEAGVAASTHYDVSHNLFTQIAGTKRFTMLPPGASRHASVARLTRAHPRAGALRSRAPPPSVLTSAPLHAAAGAHRQLRLHPYWHGSNRQAQVRWSDAAAAAPDAPVWQATLEPGDVLFVPSRVFHHAESLSDSVGINSWTGGLNRDVWQYVHQRLTEAVEACDAQPAHALLRCTPVGSISSGSHLGGGWGHCVEGLNGPLEPPRGWKSQPGRPRLAVAGAGVRGVLALLLLLVVAPEELDGRALAETPPAHGLQLLHLRAEALLSARRAMHAQSGPLCGQHP